MTQSEENYLKAIYYLSQHVMAEITTNAIAAKMETKAASVTDMIKKLRNKSLVIYERYQGVQLTELGILEARKIIRKHRLWECFLVNTLKFSWDEVHDMAEQLEHIQSEILISRLDEFLNFPTHDPHGDPIPDALGNMSEINQMILSDLKINETSQVMGVKDSSASFLQFLSKMNIGLGSTIKVINVFAFDDSMEVEIDNKHLILSSKVSSCLLVKKI
ncbi:MAG: iron-dependent repressor [Flavobacterium sp. BFFFF2]|nr:MAG: iron-dependent repressor [Flavobacterium sp. BFFFF2]